MPTPNLETTMLFLCILLPIALLTILDHAGRRMDAPAIRDLAARTVPLLYQR
jgi:hypothetical protein